MMNHSKLVGTMSSKHLIKQLKSDNQEDYVDYFQISDYLKENKEANKFDIQQDIINFVVHAIDIGHAAKPFNLELKWADFVTAEFLNQGDNEKKLGLPVSFLCDRNTSNIPASQVGFISGIVLPTFLLVICLIPKVSHYVELIEIAKEEWEKLKEQKTIGK